MKVRSRQCAFAGAADLALAHPSTRCDRLIGYCSSILTNSTDDISILLFVHCSFLFVVAHGRAAPAAPWVFPSHYCVSGCLSWEDSGQSRNACVVRKHWMDTATVFDRIGFKLEVSDGHGIKRNSSLLRTESNGDLAGFDPEPWVRQRLRESSGSCSVCAEDQLLKHL